MPPTKLSNEWNILIKKLSDTNKSAKAAAKQFDKLFKDVQELARRSSPPKPIK